MRFVIISLALFVAHSSADGQASNSAGGCYRFVSPGLRAANGRNVQFDAGVVRLDTVLEGNRAGPLPLRVVPSDAFVSIRALDGTPFSPWWFEQRDSVYVVWSDGVDILDAALVARGDSLTGLMRVRRGVPAARSPSASLVGRRVSCNRVRPRTDSAVVRLTPAAFPALPPAVRRDLEKRRCLIPQVPHLAAKPHNAIEGAFLSAASKDWAILCSIAGLSQILVYANGSSSVSDSIGRAEDSRFLQSLGAIGGTAFSRLISVVSATEIREYATAYSNSPPLPKVLDHVGIADAYVDKSSTVLYFDRGKWMRLQGAD